MCVRPQQSSPALRYSDPMKVRQAELTRRNIHTIAWIPAKLCQKGAELIDRGAKRWEVLYAYRVELDKQDLRQDWRVGGP